MYTQTVQDEKGWIGVILSDEGLFKAQTKRAKSPSEARKEADKLKKKMEEE